MSEQIFAPPPPPRRFGAAAILALIFGLLLALIVAAMMFISRGGPRVATAASHPSATADPLSQWPTSVAVRDLKVGQCGLQPANLASITYIRLVPCSQRHDFEVFAVFLLPAGPYPGLARVRRLADEGCAARFATYVGTNPARSTLDYTFFHPLAGSWDVDQFVHCLALTGPAQRGSVRDLNL